MEFGANHFMANRGIIKTFLIFCRVPRAAPSLMHVINIHKHRNFNLSSILISIQRSWYWQGLNITLTNLANVEDASMKDYEEAHGNVLEITCSLREPCA